MRGKSRTLLLFLNSFLFDSNDVSATKVFKKITVTGGGGNNSGGLGVDPTAARGQRGFGGGASNAAASFPGFSKK